MISTYAWTHRDVVDGISPALVRLAIPTHSVLSSSSSAFEKLATCQQISNVPKQW